MRLKLPWLLLLVAGLTLSTGTAHADTTEPQSEDFTAVNGRTFGPDDGVVVDHVQFELSTGSGPAGVVYGSSHPDGFGPMATWGSSYAISTEKFQLYYEGKARAAANVFQGKRIIKVCFWYSRGGQVLTSTTCSNAVAGPTYWASGPEVTDGVWDTLDWNAPKTIFNISTTRIDPDVI